MKRKRDSKKSCITPLGSGDDNRHGILWWWTRTPEAFRTCLLSLSLRP